MIILSFQADDTDDDDNKENLKYLTTSTICSTSKDDSDDAEEYSDDDDVPAFRGPIKVWDYFYIFNEELLDGEIEVIYLKESTPHGNIFQTCYQVSKPLIFYPSKRVS